MIWNILFCFSYTEIFTNIFQHSLIDSKYIFEYLSIQQHKFWCTHKKLPKICCIKCRIRRVFPFLKKKTFAEFYSPNYDVQFFMTDTKSFLRRYCEWFPKRIRYLKLNKVIRSVWCGQLLSNLSLCRMPWEVLAQDECLVK